MRDEDRGIAVLAIAIIYHTNYVVQFLRYVENAVRGKKNLSAADGAMCLQTADLAVRSPRE